MGCVFKKKYTKPLPPDSQVTRRTVRGEVQQFARWIDSKGKTQSAPLTDSADGVKRIMKTAATYTAKFRDAAGKLREKATRCRDITAARQVLANLEKRADGVRSGIRSTAEDAAIDHGRSLLSEHFSAYLVKLEVQGVTDEHRDNVKRHLDRIAGDCRFQTLADLKREALEAWLAARAKANMGARTRNSHRADMVAFGNWCVESGRLAANPFNRVAKADEAADRRRKRRALNEAELAKLLDVASRRPLEEAMLIRKGKRKGEMSAKVRDDVREQLQAIGRERALIYKTLLLTGLRKGELTSLTVGQLSLDGEVPFVTLNAADEKNREGSDIPLRADLIADLRVWLADKLTRLQDTARENGRPIPLRLPLDTPIFYVPSGLIRILNRDLAAAGIPKRDEYGRTVDVHAMRHTFVTMLSIAGVSPRTAQAAARHSDIGLTMNTYTDPMLLDVAGAVAKLPSLPLEPMTSSAAKATGTNPVVSPLAPMLAPAPAPTCPNLAQHVKMAVEASGAFDGANITVSAAPANRYGPLTSHVNGPRKERATGLEPATSSLGS